MLGLSALLVCTLTQTRSTPRSDIPNVARLDLFFSNFTEQSVPNFSGTPSDSVIVSFSLWHHFMNRRNPRYTVAEINETGIKFFNRAPGAFPNRVDIHWQFRDGRYVVVNDEAMEGDAPMYAFVRSQRALGNNTFEVQLSLRNKNSATPISSEITNVARYQWVGQGNSRRPVILGWRTL
jgi:hypothetical protein